MAVTAVTTTMAGAINYTVVTDTSADWSSVANSTYFYDKATKLVYFKNSGGAVLEIFSAGGLTYFTEAQSTAAPNATVPVDSFTAVSATTNADIAIVPKGNGAILADIPDNAAAGGNKRGTNAVDLQTSRSSAEKVASGQNAVISGGENNTASGPLATVGGGTTNLSSNYRTTVSGGISNTASGIHATVGGGYNNVSSGESSFTVGEANTASGLRAVAIGQSNTASGGNAVALGKSSTAAGTSAVAIGDGNTSNGYGSASVGVSNSVASQDFNYAFGYSNSISSGPAGNVSSALAFGIGNTVNAGGAVAIGLYGLTNGVASRQTFSPGRIATNGDSQKSTFFYRGRTTDATLTTLATDGNNSINASNCMQLANNSAYGFTGTIVGKQSGSTNAAMWKIEGLVVRGASAATTVLTTSTVTLVSNAPGWGTPVLSAFIDAFNGVGAMRIQIQGAVGTNIQWTGNVETTEVIYA